MRKHIKCFGFRTLLKLTFLVLLTGCTKMDWTTPVDVETKFWMSNGKDYEWENYNMWLGWHDPTAPLPENPWTVVSITPDWYGQGIPGYNCISANGIHLIFDPPCVNYSIRHHFKGYDADKKGYNGN